MQTVEVRIFESQIVYDANGRPVRQAARPVGSESVSGATIDERRRKALELVRKRYGPRASVSCGVDGHLVANYTVQTPPPARVVRYGSGVARNREQAPLVKASVIDLGQRNDGAESHVLPSGEDIGKFRELGALAPPYPPDALYAMHERSHALRPNVDAYSTNIEGFGHRLEPAIDLKSNDADQLVRTSLLVEKVFDGHIPTASDVEVQARKREIEATMHVEKLQLQLFFASPTGDLSFIETRKRTRQDLEVTGNGYWELVRDKRSQISQINYAPGPSLRLMPLGEPYDAKANRKISAVSYRSMANRRRFRRFVQLIDGTEAVYFRELGDPRVMSDRTGEYFPSEAAMKEKEPRARWATEMVHFRIFTPMSAYGVPRWIGATPEVLGSRAAAEINLLYFDNKTVPPLAVLVSGGSLAKGAIERIKRYLRDMKGRENFHSVLILEAEGRVPVAGAAPPRVRIELRPLTDAQHTDALFQGYDERNTEKIGGMFRLPRLLRGDVRDFNRATADAALRYAEQQVFEPERVEVDHVINHLILGGMGIRFWRFVSNSPIAKDPAELAEMLERLEGAITPAEMRDVAGPLFGREFKRVEDAWAQVPSKLFLGMLQQGFVPGADGELVPIGGAPPGGQVNQSATVGLLNSLRHELRRRVQKSAELDDTVAAMLEADPEVIRVPTGEFERWVVPDGADDEGD